MRARLAGRPGPGRRLRPTAGHAHAAHATPGATGTSRRSITTSSSPSSTSRDRTWTTSSREVGTFLPTWSARMGSSRWPRSTSTASRTAAGRPWSTSASMAARDGPARVQHVVHDDDGGRGGVEGEGRALELRLPVRRSSGRRGRR